MSWFDRLKLYSALSSDPEMVLAQARALMRQIPMLYLMLLINSLLLAMTHHGSAPDLLTIYVPGVLTVTCMGRLIFWWRSRKEELDLERARHLLTMVKKLSAVLSISFAGWSLALFPYGNAYQQGHVAFYMGITTIGCIFCLSTLRIAALILASCVLVPFIAFLILSGNPIFGAMAFNMLLVLAVLIFILLRKYSDFEQLISSRTAIAAKQQETQRLSDENYQLANLDTLTELPNRRKFDARLKELVEAAHASGSRIAVGLINIDGFKQINETFGHTTGDQMLIEVAQRIERMKRLDIFIARLGSDSFGLIIPTRADPESTMRFGKALNEAMRQPVVLPTATLHASATIGFAISEDGETAEQLLDRADYATSVAKRETRGQTVLFSQRHACEISKVRQMEHALRTADLQKEIYILLQPQYDVVRQRVTGYEVLARWRNPVLGEVSPAQFIPLAERIGEVCKITRTVLQKALEVSERLPRPLRISVNLSALDIASTSDIEAIVRMVEGAGKPCRIDFEITETAVMHDLRQANDSLLPLLALGSRIALDDFGTGHSSLTHVQKLPLDRIKIDRSFVVEVTSDPTSRAIIKTMVDLSRNLGLSCVFEGIETKEQLDALTALGGTLMQGYLFGRPMSPEAALVQALQQVEPRNSISDTA